MKKLSTKILENKGRFFGVALIGAHLCLSMVLASPSGAHALDASAADVSAKTQVGEPNAEVNAASDPIIACGAVPKDKDSSAWGKYFRVNHVNIRRSPSTHSTICAQGQKSHKVDFHCWKTGSDGRTWTFLRDVTTHYAGWVRDDLLVGYGSMVHC